jgi:tripartite ATP-independent transporter DctM subunit
MIFWIAVCFFGLLGIGVPIAFTLGLSALIYLLVLNTAPLRMIGTQMFAGVDSFAYIAIPFFILAGELMGAGGITTRLINFAGALVGRVKGGLAYTVVVAEMILSGVTGSAVADAAALGTILIPSMRKEGYNGHYATALVAAAAVLGPIIPPSLIMVVYGVTANESIGALFIGGIIPGIIIGVLLILTARFLGNWYPLPVKPSGVSFREIVGSGRDAFFSLMMPVLVIGGILSGAFTPTEAAVVACVYSLFVGMFIFKELKLSMLSSLFVKSGVTSSMVLLIASCASIFSLLLTTEMIPQRISEFVVSFATSPTSIIIMINIILLIAGALMETSALIIILTPILLPLVAKIGMHPLHFGIIMTVNLSIGLVTPPVGVCLFVGCAIGKISLEALTKAIWPFIVCHLLALAVITFAPETTLWLPRYFGYIR